MCSGKFEFEDGRQFENSFHKPLPSMQAKSTPNDSKNVKDLHYTRVKDFVFVYGNKVFSEGSPRLPVIDMRRMYRGIFLRIRGDHWA